MKLNTLYDVYVTQLKDMYSAEKQLTEALPKMVEAAHAPELKQAFSGHLAETERQLATVRNILDRLGENPTSSKCKAMAGLIEEGEEIASQDGQADARDAALIVAAQKVEHYEIATYGSLRTFADTLGYEEDAHNLQHLLDQEYAADQKLDNLAMGLRERTSLNAIAKS